MSDIVGRSIQSHAEEIAAFRRRLHACPEPGFAEVETAEAVAEALSGLACAVRTGVGGTGVVGLLEGLPGGPTVALRADLDALPVQEETGLPFASRHPGMMHACGHDAHMAMVYGAALALAGARETFRGRVKLVFQPAEELLGGARAMIEAGVLEDPRVDAMLGVHAWPEVPEGLIGWQAGPAMASLDTFTISLRGRAGHSATPHLCRDALAGAAYLVTELQGILSRETDPFAPAVVSVGSLHAGSGANVVADRAELAGTLRCLDAGLREELRAKLKARAEGIAAMWGLECQVDFAYGYPVLVNDAALTETVRDGLAEALGKEALFAVPKPSLAAEDFACYAELVPACYLKIGAGTATGETYPLHHPRFCPSDRAVLAGATALAHGALVVLNHLNPQKR